MAVFKAGTTSPQLVQMSLVGADVHWGFSPDDDRFAVCGVDHNQQVGWALYDLTKATDRKIAGETGLFVSSVNFAFSKHGTRLLVGQVSGADDMTVTAYDARTGSKEFTQQAQIEFPPYDPGRGGDLGGPSPPQNFKAKVVGSAVDLSWDPPEDEGVGAVTGYTITSTPDGPGDPHQVGADVNKLHLDGFVSGVPYVFHIVANNSSGSSAPADAKATIGGDLAAPSSPLNLKATLSGTAVNLSWDEPAYAR